MFARHEHTTRERIPPQGRHRQAVHAHDRLRLAGVRAVPHHLQHLVCHEALAGAVGLHDGLNQVLRVAPVVHQQLLTWKIQYTRQHGLIEIKRKISLDVASQKIYTRNCHAYYDVQDMHLEHGYCRFLLKFNYAIVNFWVVIKAASNVNKIDSCCPGGRFIGRHVSVHDAAAWFSIEVAHRSQKHPRRRLTALARTRVVGVVRAEVPGVHVHAEPLQLVLHESVQAAHVGLGVEALGDAGLVGHHDDLIVGVVGVAPHDIDRRGDQLKLLRLVQVPGVHVDRAVAVEHGELPRPGERREHRLRELVVLRNADVDEASGALSGAQRPLADDALEVVALQGELLRHVIQGIPTQQVDARVDEAFLARALLVEGGQGASGVDIDRAVALEVAHALNGDDGRDAIGGIGRGRLHGGEVRIEPGVTVQDTDPVRPAPAERPRHGAAGEQGRVLGAVLDRHAAVCGTEEILDLLAAIAVGDDRTVEARRGELVHDEAQEGPAGDGRHGLADIGHDVGEPGAEAARQHDRLSVGAHLLGTPEHVGLHRRAQHVVGGQVQLLDAEDLVAGHADADVRNAGEL